MLHLKNDQRVADFCGADIQPGWLISRDRRAGENWVKYEFKIKGGSGKLKAICVGDYLTHLDLNEFEAEKIEYFKKSAVIDKNSDEGKKASADYVPVDFDAYTILQDPSQKSG